MIKYYRAINESSNIILEIPFDINLFETVIKILELGTLINF